MKRLFDIFVSLSGIILLFPFFVVIAFIVKADSTGPVLFRQKRVGRYGKEFYVLKFRSMHYRKEEGGQITVGERDSRITRSGYYLRKFKIDELPQLANVFIGQMSLVGPRPEVRRYVDIYTGDQLEVLSVRPGITSTASVVYRNENDLLEKSENPEEYYTSVVMQDKLRMDLDYVHNHNFVEDLKIIMITLFGRSDIL